MRNYRRFKNILPTKTAQELYNEDSDLPKLFKAYGNRQYIELFIGIVTIMVRGIGVIFLLASLLDLYMFSYTFKVRNMQTGKTFLMSKPEWKKYREMFKEQKQNSK